MLQSGGVTCLNFNVRNCGDVVNTFMRGGGDPKEGTFANSVDPDETPQTAASHQGLRYLLW